MNAYLILVLALLLGSYALDSLLDVLNLRSFGTKVPPEFENIYDPGKFAKALEYQRESVRFTLIVRTASTAVLMLFLLLGGFNSVDRIARGFGQGPIVTGLIFAGILGVLRTVLQLPFSIYDTFVIEEKFGFNKTTPMTFIADFFKGALLSIVIGAPLFAGMTFFFERLGSAGWVYIWIGFTLFQLLLTFVAPAVILPLFNKFDPVQEGELRQAIRDYARKERFQLQGVFQMDGSRRSTKANAFFTGFGRFRRLVLFDTLIEKHTTDELMAVLAHEVGHFKLRHIIKFTVLSILTSGFLLYGLSLLLGNPGLFAAFKMQEISTYASIVFISLLFSPVFRFLSPFTHSLSRKFEYEADAFSARSYGRPEALISALKRLSADNLSHLTPHPWKVLFDYSHPPVLARIAALRAATTESAGAPGRTRP